MIDGFWFGEFLSAESLNRFIRNCESHIRTSLEYKRWVGTTYGNHKVCAICNITPAEATIEIHHHPFTLYDLVELAVYKCKRHNTLTISTLVLHWHFRNWVGWVPLCKTHHESTHSYRTQIHHTQIRGDWQTLINKCSPPKDLLTRVNHKLELGGLVLC
jgi:hypothetical protein